MSPILGSRGISPRGYGFAGAGKPNAPVSVSATDVGTARAYNNGAATVSFTSGGDNGSPITSYTVTSSPGGFTASGASSPLTVTGLQSGVSYTFTATATNSVGTSDASSASSAITATTVPQAPTIGTPTCATGQAYTGSANISVAFTAGATGGKAVSVYTATSSSTATATNSASPVTISQTVGSSYTYTVTATNANGTSSASGTSSSVLAASVPQTPTISSVGINSTSNVTVNWSGATGGSAITSVAVTSSPSLSLSYSGTSTALSVTGTFAANQAYTFTMTTTNAYGTSNTSNGVASTPNPIIPAMYIAGGAWNPTTTNGATHDYTKRDTGKFRFDTETASTASNNLARFWAKPSSISNPGVAGYIAGGTSISSAGTYLQLNAASSGGTSNQVIDKIAFVSDTWATIAATLVSNGYGNSTSSVENGSTAGYIFTDAYSVSSSPTIAVNAHKLIYSNDTNSVVRTFNAGSYSGGYQTPFSHSGSGFQNQNNTIDISNPGVKGYLRGNTGQGLGTVAFFGWNFSTDNHSSQINTASSAGGCFNISITNGSTAGYTIHPDASATTFFKMPFATETWSSTGTTLSTGRKCFSARGYTAGGAGYLTSGFNSGWLANTDKLTFSNDTRSTISVACNGTSHGTSLASVH
jgi:hypothetical protein